MYPVLTRVLSNSQYSVLEYFLTVSTQYLLEYFFLVLTKDKEKEALFNVAHLKQTA